MNFYLRDLKPGDEEGKGYVHYASRHETYVGLMPQEYLDKVTLDYCIHIARTYPQNTIVAIVDEKIVGFSCYMEEAENRASKKPSSEIMALYVLKEYQKQGIGYALLQAVLKRLTPKTVILFVLEGNDRAIEFYQKAGFVFTRHKIEKQISGKTLVELEMVLFL